MNKKIINLYEHYKNTPKKLKIVCDWDEVIQACEPYALYLACVGDKDKEKMVKSSWLMKPASFSEFFMARFWNPDKEWSTDVPVEYSPYGSKVSYVGIGLDLMKEQTEIKNSPNFYQEAPFLTIAEDLLKLIKEDKIEKLIFLSAYDKRKFSDGDQRKIDIFNETFRNFWIKGLAHEKRLCWLELIPFDNENQGQSKSDWIKQNASDFDLVIDDNPNICGSLADCEDCSEVYALHDSCMGCSHCGERCGECFQGKVLAPYYPAVENQHYPEVLLIKNEVSDLKKEDFK